MLAEKLAEAQALASSAGMKAPLSFIKELVLNSTGAAIANEDYGLLAIRLSKSHP